MIYFVILVVVFLLVLASKHVWSIMERRHTKQAKEERVARAIVDYMVEFQKWVDS